MAHRAPRGYALAHTEPMRLIAREIQKRFRATLHGAEHLPRSSGALLVGNHAYLGVDSWVLSAALARCWPRGIRGAVRDDFSEVHLLPRLECQRGLAFDRLLQRLTVAHRQVRHQYVGTGVDHPQFELLEIRFGDNRCQGATTLIDACPKAPTSFHPFNDRVRATARRDVSMRPSGAKACLRSPIGTTVVARMSLRKHRITFSSAR